MDKAKVEGWKNFSQELLDNDKKVFIKDFNGDLYFADILFVGEQNIRIRCYAPEQRKDISYTLSWNKIVRLDEVKIC